MPAYVQVTLGFVLLFGGGEVLIRGSVSLAKRLAISPLLVGATVVAFGTSAPELAVCAHAAWTNHAGLALGSVVGSNVANVLLILGFAAAVSPIAWQPAAMRRDAFLLLGSTILFVILIGTDQVLSRWEGLVMAVLLVGFTWLSYWYERQTPALTMELLEREATEIGSRAPAIWGSLGLTVAGLLGVVLGSGQLVEGASVVARERGISEATIGLTLVAVGTSLPELATSLVAAYHRHADVALGNVVGSCVFNQLGVAGVAATVSALPTPDEVMTRDIWLMLAVSTVLALVLRTRHRLGRRAGLLALLAYVLWIETKF